MLFIRVPLSWSNHLTKAPLQVLSHWGLDFKIRTLGNTNIQCIADPVYVPPHIFLAPTCSWTLATFPRESLHHPQNPFISYTSSFDLPGMQARFTFGLCCIHHGRNGSSSDAHLSQLDPWRLWLPNFWTQMRAHPKKTWIWPSNPTCWKYKEINAPKAEF